MALLHASRVARLRQGFGGRGRGKCPQVSLRTEDIFTGQAPRRNRRDQDDRQRNSGSFVASHMISLDAADAHHLTHHSNHIPSLLLARPRNVHVQRAPPCDNYMNSAK